MTTNAADESRVKDAAQREKRGRDLELDDVATMLGGSVGRRFIWRLLSMCGVFELSFNNSGSITAFNEGQRNIGLKLMADVQQFPELYLRMMQEAKSKENTNV